MSGKKTYAATPQKSDTSRMMTPVMQSRAEIDIQFRDLEYKISAAGRKNEENSEELTALV